MVTAEVGAPQTLQISQSITIALARVPDILNRLANFWITPCPSAPAHESTRYYFYPHTN